MDWKRLKYWAEAAFFFVAPLVVEEIQAELKKGKIDWSRVGSFTVLTIVAWLRLQAPKWDGSERRRPRVYRGAGAAIPGIVVALLALGSTACATLSGSQPVHVICASCALVNATGLCGASARCPEGTKAYILNYKSVVEHGADPEVACRK